MATVQELQAEINRLQAEIIRVSGELARARREGDVNGVQELESLLVSLSQQERQARAQLQQEGSRSTASAGDIVTESQRARDDSASVQNPGQAQVVIVPESRINIATEVGTNAPIRTTTQTQATPPNAPAQNPGVAARSDDATPTTSNNAQQVINRAFATPANARIVPKPNILGQFASYTYCISWYLLTPDQYNKLQTGKKDTSGWQLLMQSGGAPTQTAGTTATTPGRNQYFDLDYYLDDLEIDSLVPLKGTRMAHTATDIKFKVVEPNGVTLIQNLYRAVNDLYKQAPPSGTANTSSTTPNYVMAQYCVAVRFYGYDENGVPAQIKGQRSTTDPLAAVEKFYPFVISNIRFRMANRAIEYEVQGRPMGQFYNLSQDRGTIPFNFELSGETVKDVLVGKPVGTQYPRDDGRTDSPQPNAGSLATASVNDIRGSAGVDANGNFTGETGGPFTVVGA
jgi:hypothetical protein